MNQKLVDIVNKQINAELHSAYLYLSMAVYFEEENLPGFSNWMRIQAQEEQQHAMKFFNYLLERGAKVKLDKIDAPNTKWKNAIEVIEATFAHEKLITKMINDIADVVDEVKDRPIQSMIQWFIDEQVEEEANAEKVLNEVKMVGGEGPGMLFLDRELGRRVLEN